MLWCVYGVPGTGKTLLGGLKDGILYAVEHNLKVYTNVTGLSLAAISGLCHCPRSAVRIYPVNTVADFLEAFDNPDNFGSFFILDELKQMLSMGSKFASFIEDRLNIMRKTQNHIILIAQLPSYIPESIRDLADGCSVFKRLRKFGISKYTQEMRFDSDNGTPVMSGKKYLANSTQVRLLEPQLFTAYASYIDGAVRGEYNRSISIFKENGTKKVGCLVFVALILLGLVFYVGHSLFGVFDVVTGKAGKSAVSVAALPKNVMGLTDSIQLKKDVENAKSFCWSWIICNNGICETDLMAVPEASYIPPDIINSVSGQVVRKCRAIESANDRKLLRSGDSVSPVSK